MKNPTLRRAGLALLAGIAAAAGAPSAAHAQPIRTAELADLDLEELARVTVTSAARREQALLNAPASIFVITSEDIRRSGATSLPEALRLAPNAQVTRGDASQYVVTTRGGTEGLANKMLVLIDGRTVYSPLFSGVFWDSIATSVEDIERIEVISGPGATLWGTNAVNGVINVITRQARETQGALVAVGAGDTMRGVDARFGGAAGDATYRVFARAYDRDDLRLASGASARDEASRWQAGFRADRNRGMDSFTLQGEAFEADIGNLGGIRDVRGGNLLTRWRQHRGPGSELYVQAYYDRTHRRHADTFEETRDTLDIEAHHAWTVTDMQRLVWGAGYRASRDRTVATPALGFVPPKRTLHLASLFAQDEIRVADRLHATLGLRVERNSFTGVEWMPNARLGWQVSDDHVVWSAVSRAVRSPSRLDGDVVIPGVPPFVLEASSSFESEIATVGEVGYRGRLAPGVQVSLTAFHHDFDRLRTVEPTAASTLTIANAGRGQRTGVEGWGDFAIARDWRLSWGFTAMRHRYSVAPGRIDLGDSRNGNDPRRTAMVRSQWNLMGSHELDVTVRHRGSLPQPYVPSYTVVDARWGWHVSRNLELSLLVANVADRRFAEFAPASVNAVFERTWFLKATWRP